MIKADKHKGKIAPDGKLIITDRPKVPNKNFTEKEEFVKREVLPQE